MSLFSKGIVQPAIVVLLGVLFAACSGGGGGAAGSVGGGIGLVPQHFYVLDRGRTISTFVIDPDDGRLLPKGTGISEFFMIGPRRLVADPFGKYLFVADGVGLNQRIVRFDRDPLTGGLTFAEGVLDKLLFSGSVGSSPGELFMHPSGLFLFRRQGNTTIAITDIDIATGILTDRGTLDLGFIALGTIMSDDGRFLYVKESLAGLNSALWTIRIAGDGSLSFVDADPTTAGVQSTPFLSGENVNISLNPILNQAYAVRFSSIFSGDELVSYLVDPATGLWTEVDRIDLGADVPAPVSYFQVTPDGKIGYLVLDNGMISVYSVDSDTGVLSPVDHDLGTAGIQHFDTSSDTTSIAGLTFDPTGRYVYLRFDAFTSYIEQFEIDPNTGALSSPTASILARRFPAARQPGSPFGLPQQAAVIVRGARSPIPPAVFAYAMPNRSTVETYRIDSITGMFNLAASTTVPLSERIYVDPQYRFLFSAEIGAAEYSRFLINRDTGALTDRILTGSPQPMNRDELEIEPSGHYAFSPVGSGLNDGLSHLRIRDDGTIASVAVHPPAGTPYPGAISVAAQSNGDTVFLAGATGGIRMYERINVASYAFAIDISTHAAGNVVSDATMDATGRFLLYLNHNGGPPVSMSLMRLDFETGIPMFIDADPVAAGVNDFFAGTDPVRIEIDPTGRFVYIASGNDSQIVAYRFSGAGGAELIRIDADTSTPAVFDNFATVAQPSRLRVDSSGSYLYARVSGGVEGFAIDRDTGALTSIGLVINGGVQSLGFLPEN